MTKVQEFLRSGGTLEQLKMKYALQIKESIIFPGLWQLKYDQINSPMNEPIVAECRGIILDANNDWACVARPFDKFWNAGDFYQAKIDWATAKMTEKLDGSLIIMYFYDGAWRVATSGTPDASGAVNGYDKTFADLFWEVFGKMGLKLPDPKGEDIYFESMYTYMWELTTPFNRVVVPHHESKVTLIGVRNRNNGKEIPVLFGPDGWPKVKEVYLKTASEKEVTDTFGTMNAIEQEGWVVVDENFNRVKVKHPQYIVLHHMRGEGNPSPKKALEVILNGEHEEVLTYWPEWRPLFYEVGARLSKLEAQLLNQYSAIEHIENQKEFALEACKTRCSGALFNLRAKKTPSIHEFIRNMKVDNVVSMLELHTIDPDIVTKAVEETLNRKVENMVAERMEAAFVGQSISEVAASLVEDQTWRAATNGALIPKEDHSDHGRGDEGGPFESGCGCNSKECADAGCGFCKCSVKP